MAGTNGGVLSFKGLTLNQYIKLLDETYIEEADKVETFIASQFHEDSKKQYQINKEAYSGYPRAGSWEADGDAPDLQAVSYRWAVKATSAYIGTGTAYTKKAFDFERYDILDAAPKLLNDSLRHAQAITAAQFYQNGFSTYWNTGAAEYWFTASHTLDARSEVSTYGNLITGPLNVSNFQAARRLLETTPDELGRPGFYHADTLLIPEALLDTAIEAKGTKEGRPDTANRTPNSLLTTNPGLTIMVNPWFDRFSEDAWFLLDSKKHKAMWNWSVPEEKWTADDDHSRTHYQYGSYAYMQWLDSWRGVVASEGD